MAPKLKSAEAEAAAGGVIRASAVQYRKTESAMAGPSAATIAMLGKIICLRLTLAVAR